MSSSVFAKVYTKAPDTSTFCPNPNDSFDAQHRLQAKRKLALIPKSKSTSQPQISLGDMVEVYSKGLLGKRCSWSTQKIVLLVNQHARLITVLAKNGKRATVSFDDIRAALPNDSLTHVIQTTMDSVDDVIEDEINFSLDIELPLMK